MLEQALSVKNISKSFGDFKAVNDLSFSVNKGSIYGFLGPNGSGKSTTLRMMLSLIKPDEGEISIFGKNIQTHRSEVMKSMGCIIEKPDFYGHLTALENLKLFARASQLNFTKKDFEKLLDDVGLLGSEHKKAKTYSHGMKQRLGLAQALIHNPDFIILDEPNTGLDPEGILDLRKTMLQLNKEQGKTILFSSHILHEVELVCDAMVVINNGKKIAEGKVSELLSNEDLVIYVEMENPTFAQQKIEQSEWQKHFIKIEEHLFYFTMGKNTLPAFVHFLQKENISFLRLDYKKQLEEYFLKITKNN